MRTILLLILGLVIGAAGFHIYYLGLAPAERCRWDHPLSDTARADCRVQRSQAGYDATARHALDKLIENVGDE